MKITGFTVGIGKNQRYVLLRPIVHKDQSECFFPLICALKRTEYSQDRQRGTSPPMSIDSVNNWRSRTKISIQSEYANFVL